MKAPLLRGLSTVRLHALHTSLATVASRPTDHDIAGARRRVPLAVLADTQSVEGTHLMGLRETGADLGALENRETMHPDACHADFSWTTTLGPLPWRSTASAVNAPAPGHALDTETASPRC